LENEFRNLNLITTLTTPEEQPIYNGLVGVIYGLGCILGPIIGGAFADSGATWRWVRKATVPRLIRRH
jgi:MFS family permease